MGLEASIIIPVLDNLAITEQCLMSLRDHTQAVDHETIVIDNGSQEPIEHMASGWGAHVIRNDRNLGFPAAVNQGIRKAIGKYLVILNNDVVLTPNWLVWLLAHFETAPNLGLLGPRTNCASGRQRIPTGDLSRDGAVLRQFAEMLHKRNQGIRVAHPRIIGMCMVMPTAMQKQVGFFDERFGIGNFEDDDYCVRMRHLGFEVAIALDVFVQHLGSCTFNAPGYTGPRYSKLLRENQAKFIKKWGKTPGELHKCTNL